MYSVCVICTASHAGLGAYELVAFQERFPLEDWRHHSYCKGRPAMPASSTHYERGHRGQQKTGYSMPLRLQWRHVTHECCFVPIKVCANRGGREGGGMDESLILLAYPADSSITVTSVAFSRVCRTFLMPSVVYDITSPHVSTRCIASRLLTMGYTIKFNCSTVNN